MDLEKELADVKEKEKRAQAELKRQWHYNDAEKQTNKKLRDQLTILTRKLDSQSEGLSEQVTVLEQQLVETETDAKRTINELVMDRDQAIADADEAKAQCERELREADKDWGDKLEAMTQRADMLQRQLVEQEQYIKELTEKQELMTGDMTKERMAHFKHQLFELQASLGVDVAESVLELSIVDDVLRVVGFQEPLDSSDSERREIELNDLILSVNAAPVSSNFQLEMAMRSLGDGDVAQLELRNAATGQQRTVPVPVRLHSVPSYELRPSLGIVVSDEPSEFLLGLLGQMALRIEGVLPGPDGEMSAEEKETTWVKMDSDKSGTLEVSELAAFFGFNWEGEAATEMTDDQILEALQVRARARACV